MLHSNVDRDARDRIADSLNASSARRRRRSHSLTSSSEIAAKSEDPAIRWIDAFVAWEFSRDGNEFQRDFKLDVTKFGWDFMQRILVLLRSDFDLITEKRSHWSFTQLIAAACLGVFVVGYLHFGSGSELLGITAALGIVSMLTALFRRCRTTWWPSRDRATEPFDNIADLLAVRRSLVGFRKMRYPSHLSIRRPSRVPWASELFVTLFIGAIWLICSPIPLLVQAFPYREERTRVVVQPELVLDEA